MEIARGFLGRGWQPTPIARGQKKPLLADCGLVHRRGSSRPRGVRAGLRLIDAASDAKGPPDPVGTSAAAGRARFGHVLRGRANDRLTRRL
jgi:hypothetical protein